MPVTTPIYVPYLATDKQLFCDPNGSNSYDGLSKRFPKATIAAVMTLAATAADVWFGPASHTSWVDTITVPQSVRMHGSSETSAAGFGTEFVATGFPDDGRPGVITSTNAAADWTHGIFENIRLTGSGSMTGGGNALELRNAQNGSQIRHVQIGGWNSGAGVYLYDVWGVSSVNYPGYIKLKNVWVTGGVYNFKQESGTTGVLYELCAGDHMAPTLASFYITAKNNGASFAVSACTQAGNTVTMTATGITASAGNMVLVSGVTPAGYNGYYRIASAPDVNTITYNADTTGLGAGSAFGAAQKKHSSNRGESKFVVCKQEGTDNDVPFLLVESTQRVTLDTCAGNKVTGAGSAPLVQWNGPSVDESNIVLLEPPLTSIGTTNKNRPTHLIAPRFGGDNVDFTITAPSSGGGRGVMFNYLPRSDTAVMDVRQTPVSPVSPPSGTRRIFTDPATGELSVRTASGTTVSLEASAGGGAPTTAQYLTLATDATLSAERVFTPGTGLDITDAGAGGALTLDLDTSEFTAETVLDRFADTLLVRDTSAAAERKVLLRNLSNLRTGFAAYDELLTAVAPGANTLMAGGLSVNLATGAFTLVAGGQNHPGVTRASTGASATGRCGYLSGSSAIRFGGAETYFVATIQTEANLSSAGERYCILAGFGDNFGSASATDGVYLRYEDDLNSGKWEARCVTNSVETLADTGITVAASTWYTVEIFVNAAGDSATFYIDGTLVATITTNIPTAAGRETGIELGILKTVGTTARTLDIDSYGYMFQFTTAR